MARQLTNPTHRADVVVVGAKCAGAATALLLASAGHEVVLVDRRALPSDTLSTHAIARNGSPGSPAGATTTWSRLRRDSSLAPTGAARGSPAPSMLRSPKFAPPLVRRTTRTSRATGRRWSTTSVTACSPGPFPRTTAKRASGCAPLTTSLNASADRTPRSTHRSTRCCAPRRRPLPSAFAATACAGRRPAG